MHLEQVYHWFGSSVPNGFTVIIWKKFLYSEYKKRIIEAIEGGIDNSLISIKGNFAFTATQKSAEEGKTDYIAAGANVVFADTEEYSNDTSGNNKIGIGGWSKFKKFEAAPTGTVTAMEDTYTTEAEYNKALEYKESYVLVVISNLINTPRISYIENPISQISFTPREQTSVQTNYYSEMMAW